MLGSPLQRFKLRVGSKKLGPCQVVCYRYFEPWSGARTIVRLGETTGQAAVRVPGSSLGTRASGPPSRGPRVLSRSKGMLLTQAKSLIVAAHFSVLHFQHRTLVLFLLWHRCVARGDPMSIPKAARPNLGKLPLTFVYSKSFAMYQISQLIALSLKKVPCTVPRYTCRPVVNLQPCQGKGRESCRGPTNL